MLEFSRQRLGFLPRGFHRTAPGAVWLHAVSAGEISTAVPLLVELRKQEPRLCILVSTSTLAGRAAGVKRLAELADGVFYAPLDFNSSVRRVLRTIKPSLVLILETEIWPNLYTEVKRTGASLVIANARISDKSWPHYRSMKSFFFQCCGRPTSSFRKALPIATAITGWAFPSRLHLEGNLKYDASTAAPSVSLPTFDASPIWIAASTVAPGESRHYKHDIDEDDLVLDAFEKLRPRFPGLLLIVAPRQPGRFEPPPENWRQGEFPLFAERK